MSPSLPCPDLLSGRSYDFVSGSSGLSPRGLRARGSGEHAELAVTKPAAAADHAPLRVCGPRCRAACPFRDMRALAPPPLLSAWDGLPVSGPPCTERRLRPLCTELPTVRFAGPRRRRAPPQTSPAPRAQPYPAPPPAGLASWRHF